MNLLKKKIKVIIADDHEIFRVGLSHLLNAAEDIEVVGEASSGKELLELAQKTHCDLIITDQIMPDMNGIEAVDAIKKKRPQVKTMLLTVMDDPHIREETERVEINGYILKSQIKDRVVDAVYEILKGNTILPDSGSRERQRAAQNPFNLTEKELELIRMLALGLTYKQCAEKMGLSVKTVEFHRGKITEKMGKRSIADLTRLALSWGLIYEGEKAE